MEVRNLQVIEWDQSLEFVSRQFPLGAGAWYSQRGRESFQRLLETIRISRDDRKYLLFGYIENGEIQAVSAMTSEGLILFVTARADRQNQGMEQELIGIMNQYAGMMLGRPLSMNVPQNLVEMYRSYGFVPGGKEQQAQDMVFVPMSYHSQTVTAAEQPQGMNNKKTLIIVGCIAGVLLLLAIIGTVVGVNLWNRYQQDRIGANQYDDYDDDSDDDAFGWDDNDSYDDSDDLPDGDDTAQSIGDDGTGTATADDDTLDMIPAYQADQLSYKIDMDGYTSEEPQNGTKMDLEIAYPKVSGLPSGKDDEVNKILKDCAMMTKSEYEKGTYDELKNKVEASDQQFGVDSEVTCKVTYADENLLSVIYQDDRSFDSGWFTEELVLRTRNINLKTGEVYQMEDVIKSSPELGDQYRTKMDDKYKDYENLKELDAQVYEKMLEGEVVDNRYYTALFLSKDGLEFGFTYQFQSEQTHNIERGWRALVYPEKELEDYKKDSSFWSVYHK